MENITLSLDFIDSVPEQFLTTKPQDLYQLFPNPTVIHLNGKSNGAPLFISTLLHGNETSGCFALQRLFERYVFGDKELPRDLIVLIGNVYAAKQGVRHLEGQVDYNRIWCGGDLPEHTMAMQILAYVRERQPFACVDIHNNTGENPLYGCVNNLKPRSLHLAKLFCPLVVYFTEPKDALSVQLNNISTAVTIECGRSSEDFGIDRVVQYLEAVLQIPELEATPLTDSDVQVFHSIARINVPDQASFRFDRQPDEAYDFTFLDTIESMNFRPLPENACLGWQGPSQMMLQVTDEQGNDISDDIFKYDDNEIRINRATIPSMFCCSEKIIRQDCFGHIMQRYTLE